MFEHVYSILFFVAIALVPALCAVTAWACATKVRWPFRHLDAVGGGIIFAPTTWFALAIYGNEGGGTDADPLVFLLLVLGLSGLISIMTTAVLDRIET